MVQSFKKLSLIKLIAILGFLLTMTTQAMQAMEAVEADVEFQGGHLPDDAPSPAVQLPGFYNPTGAQQANAPAYVEPMMMPLGPAQPSAPYISPDQLRRREELRSRIDAQTALAVEEPNNEQKSNTSAIVSYLKFIPALLRGPLAALAIQLADAQSGQDKSATVVSIASKVTRLADDGIALYDAFRHVAPRATMGTNDNFHYQYLTSIMWMLQDLITIYTDDIKQLTTDKKQQKNQINLSNSSNKNKNFTDNEKKVINWALGAAETIAAVARAYCSMPNTTEETSKLKSWKTRYASFVAITADRILSEFIQNASKGNLQYKAIAELVVFVTATLIDMVRIFDLVKMLTKNKKGELVEEDDRPQDRTEPEIFAETPAANLQTEAKMQDELKEFTPTQEVQEEMEEIYPGDPSGQTKTKKGKHTKIRIGTEDPYPIDDDDNGSGSDSDNDGSTDGEDGSSGDEDGDNER